MKVLAAILGCGLALSWTCEMAPGQMRSGRDRLAERRSNSALRQVVTRHYVVHTDIGEEQLERVIPRLEAMAVEYERRTAALSDRGEARSLPFYLFADLNSYHRAGGEVGTAGFFDGDRLLANVGERADARAWHVIQHEAFHQYLAAKLGRELPPWLNEGLADYFGESAYTGDGFVSGITPPWRVQRVQEAIRAGQMRPLRELIALEYQEWNDGKRQADYDQAWSLMHFLAHTEGGAGQDRLFELIQQSGRGANPVRQLEQHIGALPRVEEAWEQFWLEMTPESMRDGYAEAAVQTVSSYAVRAALAGQPIKTVRELRELARKGQLPQPAGNELPLDVLTEVMEWAVPLGNWTLATEPAAEVHATLERGTLPPVRGRAIVRDGQVVGVESWRGERARVVDEASRPADRRSGRTRAATRPVR